MPSYYVAYHGGVQSENSEDNAKNQEKFGAWLGSLGDAVVNPGTPLGNLKVVSTEGVSNGPSENSLTGFSILKADNMEAALEMAKQCPFLDIKGTIQVAEIMEMC